jgi:hypothetical protein
MADDARAKDAPDIVRAAASLAVAMRIVRSGASPRQRDEFSDLLNAAADALKQAATTKYDFDVLTGHPLLPHHPWNDEHA